MGCRVACVFVAQFGCAMWIGCWCLLPYFPLKFGWDFTKLILIAPIGGIIVINVGVEMREVRFAA